MDTVDIEFEYEQRKRKVLARIQEINEEWQNIRDKSVGNPEAEALVVQAKLRIQLMEAEAAADLKEIEQKIEAFKNKINKEEDEPGTE